VHKVSCDCLTHKLLPEYLLAIGTTQCGDPQQLVIGTIIKWAELSCWFGNMWRNRWVELERSMWIFPMDKTGPFFHCMSACVSVCAHECVVCVLSVMENIVPTHCSIAHLKCYRVLVGAWAHSANWWISLTGYSVTVCVIYNTNYLPQNANVFPYNTLPVLGLSIRHQSAWICCLGPCAISYPLKLQSGICCIAE
jgi:hypothetical protein